MSLSETCFIATAQPCHIRVIREGPSFEPADAASAAAQTTVYGVDSDVRDPQSTGLFSTGPSPVQILSITGELKEYSADERSITFTYSSSVRCLVSLNKTPLQVFVDGNEAKLIPMEGHRRVTVLLPHGTHRVRIITKSTISYGIDLTSLWSSSLIALFAGVAVILLLIFWAVIKFQARHKAVRAT